MSKLLTIEQVAKILAVEPAFVLDLIAHGTIEACELRPGIVRVPDTGVRRFIGVRLRDYAATTVAMLDKS